VWLRISAIVITGIGIVITPIGHRDRSEATLAVR